MVCEEPSMPPSRPFGITYSSTIGIEIGPLGLEKKYFVLPTTVR